MNNFHILHNNWPRAEGKADLLLRRSTPEAAKTSCFHNKRLNFSHPLLAAASLLDQDWNYYDFLKGGVI
jgi:hypothetical protein